VTSTVYDLPFDRQKTSAREVVGKVLGGWKLNSIVTIASGFP